ncbi:MAG: DUF2214 family protein [Gammaproteobacteria bacterium]|nr:DUF2214 family protein [Gammaproteobacteria bacterium]
MSTILAFLHHLAAFTFVTALAVEYVTIRDKLSEPNARRLIAADAVYAASATLVLIVGFVRVYYYEKGADYYWNSVPFIAKIGLFAVVALLSFYPSAEFLRWKKQLNEELVPDVTGNKMQIIRKIIHVELIGVVLILLSAAMMARGVGH